jgi:hypothetical protein
VVVTRVRQRRVPWVSATTVVALVGLLVAIGAVAHARAQDTLAPSTGTTAIRDSGLRVGQSEDFGVSIENVSSDTTLTLRSVSLPRMACRRTSICSTSSTRPLAFSAAVAGPSIAI